MNVTQLEELLTRETNEIKKLVQNIEENVAGHIVFLDPIAHYPNLIQSIQLLAIHEKHHFMIMKNNYEMIDTPENLNIKKIRCFLKKHLTFYLIHHLIPTNSPTNPFAFSKAFSICSNPVPPALLRRFTAAYGDSTSYKSSSNNELISLYVSSGTSTK